MLSVLIPTYNGARWLPRTLASLREATDGILCEAIVVDNASGDGTAAIAQRIPGITVVRNEVNAGFSRAVNRAARAARGETLVVVNQDLQLLPGALRAVSEFLSAHTVIVGGRLRSANNEFQPSCGPWPSLVRTAWRFVIRRAIRKYYLRHPASGPGLVDWATGAFLAFPRVVFDAVGGFDERFFMYYEDVDFCLRARRKGFPVYYLPAAEAVHVAPYAEREDAPDWLRREVRISQMRYFAKHRPRWESTVIRGLNRTYFAAKGWEWPPQGMGRATAE